jgi:hypothetical protein
LPGIEVSSQNLKVFVPGSPIGQQQDGAERRAWIGAEWVSGRGAGAATGAGAGLGPTAGGVRSGWMFDRGMAAGSGATGPAPALASGGRVGPAIRG